MAEEKISISELEQQKTIDKSDLLVISKQYGTNTSYKTYSINLENFISSALSDYANIKDWMYCIVRDISSKYIDEKFVHKVIDAEGEFRYETIEGGKIFNELPSCNINPTYDDDLVRTGYLKTYTSSYVSNYVSSSLSDYSLTSHTHDYIPNSNITQELGPSETLVVSQKLLSTNLGNIKSYLKGQDGDVLYVSQEGAKTQQINEKILVCENKNEVDKCKSAESEEYRKQTIVGIYNDQVLQYDNAAKIWKQIPEATPISFIKAGRMAYNAITKKLFFNNGTEIYSIGTETDLSPIYQILQGQLTYLNQIV